MAALVLGRDGIRRGPDRKVLGRPQSGCRRILVLEDDCMFDDLHNKHSIDSVEFTKNKDSRLSFVELVS